MGRRVRCRLDAMTPKLAVEQKSKTETVKDYREFNIGDKVLIRSYTSSEEKWFEGQVVQKLGKLHYMVKDEDGREMKRHIDQLKLSHLKKGVIIIPSVQQDQSIQQEKKEVKVDQENMPVDIPQKRELPQRSTRNKLPARYADNYILTGRI